MSCIREESAPIPYRSQLVPFLRVKGDEIQAVNRITEKREWLQEDIPIYAAWPGSYRTDVFPVVLEDARAAIG